VTGGESRYLPLRGLLRYDSRDFLFSFLQLQLLEKHIMAWEKQQ
jgi:hypothetical protein